MRSLATFVLLVSVSGSQADVKQGGVNSITKVVQMLGDMLAKAKMSKNNEEIGFAEFTQWCTDEKANLANSIKVEAESIETFSNSVAKLQSDIRTLGADIGTLNADLAKFHSDLKADKRQREKDHAEFLAEEQDFSESVDAIEQPSKCCKSRTTIAKARLRLSCRSQRVRSCRLMPKQ